MINMSDCLDQIQPKKENTDSSLIKTDCEFNTSGNEIAEGKDIAIETQSMSSDTHEDQQKFYTQVQTALLVLQEQEKELEKK